MQYYVVECPTPEIAHDYARRVGLCGWTPIICGALLAMEVTCAAHQSAVQVYLPAGGELLEEADALSRYEWLRPPEQLQEPVQHDAPEQPSSGKDAVQTSSLETHTLKVIPREDLFSAGSILTGLVSLCRANATWAKPQAADEFRRAAEWLEAHIPLHLWKVEVPAEESSGDGDDDEDDY